MKKVFVYVMTHNIRLLS